MTPYIIGLPILLVLGWFTVYKVMGLTVIGSDEIGIVEKWWSPKGSVKNGFIALQGEAGYQPDVLRAGIHFNSRFLFRVRKTKLVTISQGEVGYVFARDGEALEPTQTLGCKVDCSNFQDTRAFLKNGGQKGPQRSLLREGTYAFNLAQFIIMTSSGTHTVHVGDPKSELEMITIMRNKIESESGFRPVVIAASEDQIGIITIHDGPSLPNGEIIAPVVGGDKDSPNYHNNFQDVEAFLDGGGYRGKQLQVLTDGTYFINRLFATIKVANKTVIPVGFAGVVTSYTGVKGNDLSGTTYRHGELVEDGQKGIWRKSLGPGKYAFNTDACKVDMVPTTNIILKWDSMAIGTHNLDENLKEVDLITKDAFEPILSLSVVVHIDYEKASRVIQRFGDVKRLIEHSLDPVISAHFKNIGQTKTLIELVQERTQIQQEASIAMGSRFSDYDLELKEILMGTPTAKVGDKMIENMLEQLRARQLAEEQRKTFDSQQKTAEKQKQLNEVKSIADRQTALTESAINIDIEINKGKAEAQKAVQDAQRKVTLAEAESKQIQILAGAEANQIQILAEARAFKTTKEGLASAISTEANVNAYGGPQYQIIKEILIPFCEAIKEGGIQLTPQQVVMMGGESDGIPNVFESLIKTMLANKFGIDTTSIMDPALKSRMDEMKKAVLDATRTEEQPQES